MSKTPHISGDSSPQSQIVPHVTRQYFNKLAHITKIIKKKTQKSLKTQKMLEKYLAQFNQNKSKNADTYLCKTCRKSFKGREKYAGHCRAHKTIVSSYKGPKDSQPKNIEQKVPKVNDESNEISMMKEKERSSKIMQSQKSEQKQLFQEIYEESEFISQDVF